MRDGGGGDAAIAGRGEQRGDRGCILVAEPTGLTENPMKERKESRGAAGSGPGKPLHGMGKAPWERIEGGTCR